MFEYKSFRELQLDEREMIDYQIIIQQRNPEVAVFAIHGGNIEMGTSEVAEKLGEALQATTYILEGLKSKGNRKLHITSSLFDEPKAIAIGAAAQTAISIHGYHDMAVEKILLGGRNHSYKKIIRKYLTESGFQVEEPPRYLHGVSKRNIINQNKTGTGVQLELSTKLRKSFFQNNDLSQSNRQHTTERFALFIEVLAKATQAYKNKWAD